MGHLPGGHAPGRAPRMMGLADDVAVQDAHGGDTRPAGPRTRRPRSPPACTARGMLPSCRVPMTGSQCLQAHLKSTRPATADHRRTGPPHGRRRLGPALLRGARPAPRAAQDFRAAPLSRIGGHDRRRDPAQSDAGFTLAEQKALMAPRDGAPRLARARAAQARGTRRADRPRRRPPATPSATGCAARAGPPPNAPTSRPSALTSRPASPPAAPAPLGRVPTSASGRRNVAAGRPR